MKVSSNSSPLQSDALNPQTKTHYTKGSLSVEEHNADWRTELTSPALIFNIKVTILSKCYYRWSRERTLNEFLLMWMLGAREWRGRAVAERAR